MRLTRKEKKYISGKGVNIGESMNKTFRNLKRINLENKIYTNF